MHKILLPLEPLLQLVSGQVEGMPDPSPRVLDAIATVDPQVACAMKERGGLICDIRCRRKWRAARIPGALNLHLDALSEFDLARFARKDTPIVFYGEGHGSYDAAVAVRRVHGWGYRSACWLPSGLAGWIAAGYPAEKYMHRRALPPQDLAFAQPMGAAAD